MQRAIQKIKTQFCFPRLCHPRQETDGKKADGEYKESVTQYQSTLSGSKIIAAAVLPL